MVRLKLEAPNTEDGNYAGFNSSMVRLKRSKYSGKHNVYLLFQFLNGSIKALKSWKLFICWLLVSIPQWFD